MSISGIVVEKDSPIIRFSFLASSSIMLSAAVIVDAASAMDRSPEAELKGFSSGVPLCNLTEIMENGSPLRSYNAISVSRRSSAHR